ncbi:MAG: LytR family transcriptional regulator [Ruminococcaceae bacterium]|jgi:LCP family protein required for cell wall assembly|nr:LytR family transcriptional regulator [Oscillospiraceae bacterium]
MDDLFSNSPKNDDFEDISSHSDKSDDFEDIFSDSQREINDLFSDFPSFENKSEKAAAVETEREKSFDMSYFTDSPVSVAEYRKNSADKGEGVKTDNQDFEDISSNSNGGKNGGKKKKVIFGILAVLLAFVVGAAVFVVLNYNDILNQLNYKESEKNKYVDENELTRGDGITNILLIGSDTRADDTAGSRSDTTILLSLDTKSKQIKLASFLRDSYVEIPEYGYSKLNAAFSNGGSQLLMDTLEYNFKVDIDYYIAIDFEAFKDVIDKLGGVDVEITDNEARYINSHDHMTSAEREAFPNAISGGMNHFTGAQALWYCRIRYLDSDFNRTERQRKTLNAALQKAKSKSIPELLDLAKFGASLVTTDITKQKINSYTQQALSFLKYEIVGMQIPADETWHSEMTNAGDSLVFDLEANKEKLNSFIYGGKYVDPAETTEATSE